MRPGDWTQVARLDGKCFDPLSHFDSRCLCVCSLCVCVHPSTVELTYFNTSEHGWLLPVNKLKQFPTWMQRLYKQTQQQSGNRQRCSFSSLSLSSSFCFLRLQLQRKCSSEAASDRPYAIRHHKASLIQEKPRQSDNAVPHLEHRGTAYPKATWSKDMYSHFSSIHQHQRRRGGKHRYYPMGYFLQFAYQRLRIVVCNHYTAFCICIYICTGIIQFWWTKLEVFTRQTEALS